ncbi:hypothetical protein CTAYLR_002815 [Chrysophaeum taylorii]|uniref:Tetratricopeptide repeat protein n=1 Tax=Chrysophaeum taylorii TaxID=2483200 RepID=A0AAD7UA48_9STRA|nr:hypothetical protein CTAYLR_002815 [Chrysophaeum taylorii]
MTVERKGEKFVKLVDSDGKPLPRDERHRVLGPHLKVAYAQLKHPNLAAVRVSKTRDGVLFAEETGRTLADAQLSTEVAAVIALKMARAVLFLESNGLTADLSPSSVLVDVAREPFYFSNATRVRSVKLTGVKEGGPGSDPGWGNLFESMLYESPSMLTAADNPLRAPCLEIAKRGPRSAGQLAKLLEAHGVHEPEASKAEPAELYDTLGSAFFDYSPQIAEELLREFLSRTEDKATGHARLAFALKSRRKFDEAVEHLNAAIEIDDEPRKKATHLQSLAMVLYRQGKFDDARPHLERAVAFFERYEPARLATALNNLAGLLYHQGEDARPLYLRALEIDTKTYGEAHPKVALRLNNLAHVYGDEGDHKTALEHISRCLKIWEKTTTKPTSSISSN